MTGEEYKAIIAYLGMTQEGAGRWLGLSERTGQNYAKFGPPEPVAKLLRLIVEREIQPEDVI
jgi:hypothetical protein